MSADQQQRRSSWRVASLPRSPAAASEAFSGDGLCMLEAGEGQAGVAYGDFFAEPSPRVQVRNIGRTWHLGKVLFEQWSLAPWGLRRAPWAFAIKLGSKIYGVPVTL